MFITTILIIISAFRCQYYFNFYIKPNSIDFITNFLARSDPLIAITELVLSSVILYRREKFEDLIRTVLDLSTKETKQSAMVVACVNVVMLFAFFKYSLNLWLNNRALLTMKLDCIVCCLNITMRTASLMFIVAILFVINFNLEKWKEELVQSKNNLSKKYQNLLRNLELYNKFSETFYFLMIISLLHCFYGLLLGLKRSKDALRRSADDIQGQFDDIIIFFNFFHLPMILLICHEGQIFQEKVTMTLIRLRIFLMIVFIQLKIQKALEMMNVSYLNLRTPALLSMSNYVQFSKDFKLTCNHRTIFQFSAQILSYFLITLQFSDLLESF